MIDILKRVLEQNPSTPPHELAQVLWAEILDNCPLLYETEFGDSSDLTDVLEAADLNHVSVVRVHLQLMLPDPQVFRKVGDEWEEVL